MALRRHSREVRANPGTKTGGREARASPGTKTGGREARANPGTKTGGAAGELGESVIRNPKSPIRNRQSPIRDPQSRIPHPQSTVRGPTMPTQTSNQKAIYRWIGEQTPEGGRVLDIGCGDGELLAWLVSARRVRAAGIELSEECLAKAVQRGLSVHHGNVEEGLDHYDDRSFDLVVMSLAVQEMQKPLRVLQECFRVGKRVLVVFPNFGHYLARWHLGFLGHAPRTPSFPHTWESSPNRHFFTVKDWDDFCAQQGWTTVRRAFVTKGKSVRFCPNLLAEVALYLMETGR